MKVSQNIGILNALIRITCGMTMLAWCTAKLVKRPSKASYLLLAAAGAMKVAEGIVRYCPLTAYIQSMDHENGSVHQQSSGHISGDSNNTSQQKSSAQDFDDF